MLKNDGVPGEEHSCVCDSCALAIRANERRKLVKLIRSVYNNDTVGEYGAFVWSEDIVDLIERGSNDDMFGAEAAPASD